MTPSTTTSGEFDLLMLVGERRRMLVPLPGCPGGTIVTADTLPWIDSIAFVDGTGMFSTSMRPTVNGTRVPDVGSVTPVVTTACNVSGTATIWMSTVTVAPSCTFTFGMRDALY